MKFTAQQIAALAGGEVDGNPQAEVAHFARIEEAEPGSITFLSNPKYDHFVYSTQASVVLVRKDFKPEHPVAATLIRVDDPYATLAFLLSQVNAMLNPPKRGIEQPCFIAEGVEIPDDAYIGAFAYIGSGAKIGRGAQIYPQAYVGDGSVIGDGSILYAGAKVYHHCSVGANCIIHAGAVVGSDGFGFAPVGQEYHKIPQLGNVVIDDNVEIGANTTIDRAVMGSTTIGRGVKLDNLIQIAHNCAVGPNTVMAAQAGLAGSAKVGEHCMVGGQVGIVGHNRIGDNVQIGAQSGVASSVEDGARVMGSPALPFRENARILAALRRLPEIITIVNRLERQNNQ